MQKKIKKKIIDKHNLILEDLNKEVSFNKCLENYTFYANNNNIKKYKNHQLNWLLKAEIINKDTSGYIYFLLGKYYYYNLLPLDAYHNFLKVNIENSSELLYYLGCLEFILEIRKSMKDRNYKKAYFYFLKSSQLGNKESKKQLQFIKKYIAL